MPKGSSDLPESTTGRRIAFCSVLLRMEFTCARPVTRTAVVSYTAFPPLPWQAMAVYFCCTGLGVASTGRYPASCPVKPGLSSSEPFRLSSRDHLACLTSIATLSFTDNTSILNRSGDATITSATINLNGADEGTVLPGGKAPATQPPVTPPTTTGPSYQIVWGNGGSNSTELWAKPSTSNPTGSDEWAKPSTDSNKTNPSMGGAR